ncbi:sensor histidine kinase [Halalkalibacter urbisdiaboli]|uniref:sensor histidine kinase n=1 Tax=Halalkalibacter urbisdiaboli TaxID=1960589 RepID=UPI0013FDD0B8|nr:HAMP domain-containing sensor histidine kinase [Halalkalibacter urbisdiaboli]
MSIRFKLLISYILAILAPIILLSLFILLTMNIFSEHLSGLKNFYNIAETDTFESFLNDELFPIVNVQNEVRQDPDHLLTESYLSLYTSQLEKRQAGFFVIKGTEFIYQSDLFTKAITEQLSKPYGPSIYHTEAITMDGRSYQSLRMAVEYGDGTPGALYLVIETSPIVKILNTSLPTVGLLFLFSVIVTNCLLTHFISRSVIKSLQDLKGAAEHIKEGNLDFSLETCHCKDEIGQVVDAFEEMRIRLKESIETNLKVDNNRKELISNISHDLRTPVTAIKGYVEGIRDGVANNPEKLDRYIETIYKKASDLDKLIDELFFYSKLDLKRVSFHFEEVNSNDYLQDCIDDLRIDFRCKNVHFNYENNNLYETTVMADRVQLKRVILNIIENSLKFIEKEEKRISVTLKEEAEYVAIEITDNGIGISSEHLPLIFDRFYREDSARSNENGGSGLGLAIAKEIILAHGGRICAESKLGDGTTIRFTLKRVLSDDAYAKEKGGIE